jgi:hypothetical protein
VIRTEGLGVCQRQWAVALQQSLSVLCCMHMLLGQLALQVLRSQMHEGHG